MREEHDRVGSVRLEHPVCDQGERRRGDAATPLVGADVVADLERTYTGAKPDPPDRLACPADRERGCVRVDRVHRWAGEGPPEVATGHRIGRRRSDLSAILHARRTDLDLARPQHDLAPAHPYSRIR